MTTITIKKDAKRMLSKYEKDSDQKLKELVNESTNKATLKDHFEVILSRDGLVSNYKEYKEFFDTETTSDTAIYIPDNSISNLRNYKHPQERWTDVIRKIIYVERDGYQEVLKKTPWNSSASLTTYGANLWVEIKDLIE